MSQWRGGPSAWLAAALVALAAATGPPVADLGVRLTATTALIMGGTLHPLLGEPDAFVNGYLADSLDRYIAPTGAARGDSGAPDGYQTLALATPEQFWPIFGDLSFDESVSAGAANLTAALGDAAGSVVVFGYSQSARIATVVQRTVVGGSELSFVLVANPNRPNGGILQRFAGLVVPVLGVTFDGATPTDRFPTADISQQYDGWSDFPARPLNLLADLNALAGIALLHSHYDMAVDDTMIQTVTGNTTYYLIPTPRLPILMALEYLGVPSPILTALDAPLRVIIEWAYDRSDPGEATLARTTGQTDLVTAASNLAAAIPTGLDDGLAEAGMGRPFGTVAAGPFGVGGPPVTPRPGTPVSARTAVVPTGAAAGVRARTTAPPVHRLQQAGSRGTVSRTTQGGVLAHGDHGKRGPQESISVDSAGQR